MKMKKKLILKEKDKKKQKFLTQPTNSFIHHMKRQRLGKLEWLLKEIKTKKLLT
jgi:quinolinate synthase